MMMRGGKLRVISILLRENDPIERDTITDRKEIKEMY